MENAENYYLKIGSAADLSGKDYLLYRSLEILPGFLAWSTILGVIILSWLEPVWVAFFIITFDIYWLVKTVFLSVHLRVNWKRMRQNIKIDWEEKLALFGSRASETAFPTKSGELWQMIILPFYKEGPETIDASIKALLAAKWPKEKMMIALAYEERAGKEAEKTAREIYENYKNDFGYFILTKHPANLAGEIPGKGSNISWAAKKTEEEIINRHKIDPAKILVSAFDIDTIIYPQYFTALAYYFLTAKRPYRSSFQPIPLYNNNIWDAHFFSRVVATSGTFWQMMQQERPERLATFSSHSMTFSSLQKVGFWQKNMVSEDSRIFWNSLLKFNGDYRVTPLSYPVSMDANIGKNFWQTMKNVYRQQRRWCWGVENVPYLLFGFIKNKKIPFVKKLRFSFVQLEGFWSLATNPLLIFMLGWLPLLLGGQEFNASLLSYNLPRITRNLMNIAMLGLIGSAIISTALLPKRPKGVKKWRYILMVGQWIFIPFTIIFFGALPGFEAQTRLMLGGRFRLGFWVTPKRGQSPSK